MTLLGILTLAACASAPPGIEREIRARYDELERAYAAQDVETVLAVRHPQFEAFSEGEHDDAARMAELTREWFATNKPPIEMNYLIESIDVRSPDEVSVRVLLRDRRMREQGGRLRRVEHEVWQTDTWVRTPDGWRVRRWDVDVPTRKLWVDGVPQTPRYPTAEAQIRKQYDALERAFAAQDIPAILAVRHPQFEVFGPNGQHDTYERMAEYTRQWFVTNKPPIEVHFTIESAEVISRDEVAVQVLQRASRMQERDGKLRRVEHEVRQRETWVRTASGWRIRKVDNIDLANRKRWIDGVPE